jgi:F-box and WD-40 domain protein 1/11
MLTYNSHIQAAIDREPDALLRSQLRQVVSASLVRAQIAQNRIQESVQQALALEGGSSYTQATSSQPPPPRPSQPMSLSELLNGDPGPSTVSGTSTGSGPPSTLIHSTHSHQSHQALPQPLASQPFAMHIHHHGQSQPAPVLAPVLAHVENHSQGHGQAHPHGAGDQPVHPHIPQADASPARIFKLQFDARQIICCSQVSTIVGWDFCNGDAELEEVSRFFGTVK